jgi:glycosyltransferase involved in cell wall biosynthesis
VAVPARDPFAFYGLGPMPRLTIEPVAGPQGLRARRAHFLFSGIRRLLGSKADVVYTRDLGLASVLLRVPRWRRPPLVYESHGLSVAVSEEMPQLLGNDQLAASPSKLRRLDRRERQVWHGAEGYVTITRLLADDLAARYGSRNRVEVVPDGAAMTTAPVPPPFDRPLAAYAGHLYPWKGVDVFLQALALTPAIRGLIVGGHPGEPDMARVRGLIERLGLSGRVDVTGLVPHGEVAARLAPATMLVLPNVRSTISERYTSPLKLFEYLSMGRPIVASDLPALREVLTDRVTALLVPPDDRASLAGAMECLVRDRPLSDQLARAAAELAPQFSWTRRAERLESMFADIAA